MAYGKNLPSSAKRHLRAADELHGSVSGGSQPGCKAVAGYLFGISGEVAVKEMMRDSGMRPLGVESRRDDPFYAHFPELKTHLRDTAKGRRGDELRKIGENAGLFQYWDPNMRYAPTADIEDAWVDSWRISAHDLVDRMGAL
jgi:hypothetical protein